MVGAERIHNAITYNFIKNTYTHNHTTFSEAILSDAERKGWKVSYTTIEIRAGLTSSKSAAIADKVLP